MRTFPYVGRAACGVLPHETPRSHNPSLCTRPASASCACCGGSASMRCVAKLLHALCASARHPWLAASFSSARLRAGCWPRLRQVLCRALKGQEPLSGKSESPPRAAAQPLRGWSRPRTCIASSPTAKARNVTCEESCSLVSFEDSAVLGASRPSRLRRSLREPGLTCARRWDFSANSDHA